MTACLCQYTYSLVMRLSCTMCLKWSFTACIPLNHHTHTHRSHTYQFEDFLLSWGDKLKSSGEPNSITVRLQKDVDKFHVSKQFFFIAVQSFLLLVRTFYWPSEDQGSSQSGQQYMYFRSIGVTLCICTACDLKIWV